jgi:phosphatidate cytidylyltransferase
MIAGSPPTLRAALLPGLARRLMTTAVGMSALAYLITTEYGLAAAAGVALFAAGYEYRSITVPSGRPRGRLAGGLGAVGAGGVAMLLAPWPLAAAGLAVGAAAWMVLWIVPTRRSGTGVGAGPAVALRGALYFGALPAFLLLLQRSGGEHASYWVWLALAVSWGGDVGGYLAGRLWGRRPLAPRVSPRKTVEGALGALLLGTGLGLAVWSTDRAALPLATLAWLAPTTQSLSQAGDLLESRLKRLCAVKDSGGVLPGLGGMLDCVDGLCLAAPWLYFASGLAWR